MHESVDNRDVSRFIPSDMSSPTLRELGVPAPTRRE